MKPKRRNPGVRPTPGFQHSKTDNNGPSNTPECSAGLDDTTARPEPTHFYCVSIYSKGKHHKLAVWNGMHEYESRPPPSLVAMMNNGESRTIFIVQVGKPMNTPERSVIETCSLLIRRCDDIILWARNQEVYDSIKAEYKQKTNTLVSPDHLTPQ